MALWFLAAACGAKTPPTATETVPSTGTPEVDGGLGHTTSNTGAGASGAGVVTCKSNSDCGAGEMCSGAEGCDAPWTCVPSRPCTRDLVVYCGCDGQEHRGSGSCPPAPYKHKGECP